MKNLYSFSKNAWHVKLFKWAWDIDATKHFKTMCPYFWQLILTILVLPIIALANGWKYLGNIHSNYRSKRRIIDHQKNKEKLIALCVTITTGFDAWKLVKSKCWSDYNYILPYNEYSRIYELYWNYREKLHLKKQQRTTELLNKTYIKIILGTIAVLVASYVLYNIFLLLSAVCAAIDWAVFLKTILIIVIAITTMGGIIWVGIQIQDYRDSRKCNSCTSSPWKIWGYIAKPFKFVWYGFVIVGDMIYNFYKQQCPLIQWKDEEDN